MTTLPFTSLNRIRTRLKLKTLVSILLCLFIACSWGHTGWIKGKAVLAQYLIADAWQQSLTSKETIKPWSWADTWPVAQLEFPALNESMYVLAGSHGTSLAFGPGLADGTALPGEHGTTIIHGHRDTHFALLENLSVGDIVRIQSSEGHWQRYVISDIHIIDTRSHKWLIDPTEHTLQLVTCYPFNSSNVNPPLRYVVEARATSHSPISAVETQQVPRLKMHTAPAI